MFEKFADTVFYGKITVFFVRWLISYLKTINENKYAKKSYDFDNDFSKYTAILILCIRITELFFHNPTTPGDANNWKANLSLFFQSKHFSVSHTFYFI